MIEQEVKLQFSDIEAARRAVITAGGRLDVSRRLLDDRLFDSIDGSLRQSGTALRVRRDAARAFLTFKGPSRPGPVKSREELETTIGDATIVESVLAALGFRPVFRGQKFREEFSIGGAHVMVDETPFGVFIEIEAPPAEIADVAKALGKSPADYSLESYPALWRRYCEQHGLGKRDMLFEAP